MEHVYLDRAVQYHRPKPSHPAGRATLDDGEIFARNFLDELQMSFEDLAERLEVPVPVLRDVVEDRRPIDADIDLRLGCYSGISSGFFLNLRSDREIVFVAIDSVPTCNASHRE